MAHDPRFRARSLAQAVTATSLAGAAIIHLVVAPQHFREWFLAGVFFVSLALVQASGAGAVLNDRFARSPILRLVLSALTTGTILLWLISRTAGVPFGPDGGMPERVGVLDLGSTILETVTLLALWVFSKRINREKRQCRVEAPTKRDIRAAA